MSERAELRRGFLGKAALFGVSLLAIQGTAYSLQFAAAAQLPAAEFSSIRVTESLVALLSLLATFGVPSAFIPAVANARDLAHRSLIVRTGLASVTAFVVVVAAGYAVAVRTGAVARAFSFAVPLVLLLAALISLRLALVSATQASQDFGRLTAIAIPSCAAALSTYAAGRVLSFDAAAAWLAARLILESLLCAGLLVNQVRRLSGSVRPRETAAGLGARRAWRRPALALLATALPLGLSLLIRALLEHGPVLWLASFVLRKEVVAETGVVLTLVTVAMMPAAIVQGALLPRLSALLGSDAPDIGALRQLGLLFLASVAGAVVIFVCAALGARQLVSWGTFLRPPTVLVGAVILAAKASSNASGGYLLAASRARAILLLNGAMLASAMAVAGAVRWWAGAEITADGALRAVALVELLAMALYVPAATAVARRATRGAGHRERDRTGATGSAP